MLTNEEYNRLVLKGDSRRSSSMFESCLLPQHMLQNPQITAHGRVADSLQADREAFLAKYGEGALETDGEELGTKGAYCKALPETPQHKKYTLEEAMKKEGIMEKQLSNDRPKGPKFNIPTLRKWFAEIDADGGGQVSRRELIVAMRNHKDLQQVLLSASQTASGGGASAEDDVLQAKNAELRRIMQVMAEVDTDNSGYMDWEEFVEFFRRSGFLLEYDTRKTLNDASFKKDDFLNVSTGLQSQLRMARLTSEDGAGDPITEEDLVPDLKSGEDLVPESVPDLVPRREGSRSPKSPRDGSPRSPRSGISLFSNQPGHHSGGPVHSVSPHELLPAHMMTKALSQSPGSKHGASGLAATEKNFAAQRKIQSAKH